MALSVVVLFEILAGADAAQQDFWKGFLRGAVRLPFDERVAEIAADIFRKLRQKNIRLESCDVFIAATAIANDLPLMTLNRKHFEQVDGLKLFCPEPTYS
jgi:predicted nucleic acid-binding protein